MSGLSNIFRWRDAAPVEIRPVGPGEIEPALRLILGSHGGRADAATAAEFEGFAQERQIDLTLIQVAAAGSRVLAACLPLISPGRTALLMTSTAGASATLAGHLAQCVDVATRQLTGSEPSRVQIAQVLLEPSELRLEQELRRIGFQGIACLIYLQRTVSAPPPPPTFPEGYSLVRYSPDRHGLFAQAILTTYENSLDCPALHNKRAIEDIMAGHRATGDHDPNLWFCLMQGGEPRGVLLLAGVHGHNAMELVYLGLAPVARGQRLGDLLLKLALYEMGARGLSQLTLAVDAENVPAVRLYHRHGLGEVHRRTALMKLA